MSIYWHSLTDLNSVINKDKTNKPVINATDLFFIF